MPKADAPALLCAALVMVTAMAGGPTAVAEGDARIISESRSTSTCIGDPRTPACAVETVIACFALHRIELCRAAGVEKTVDLALMEAPGVVEYVIKAVRELEPGDRYCWRGNPGGRCVIYETGLFSVSVLRKIGRGAGAVSLQTDYLVREVDGRWRVLEWASSDADEADGRPSPEDHPELLSVISKSEATSDCIGNPRTPACAVETFKACGIRAKPELCRTVGVHEPRFWTEASDLPLRYYIDRIEEFAPGDVYCSNIDATTDCRIPGQGFAAVYLGFQQCHPEDLFCTEEPFHRERCLVQDTGRGWRVVGCEEDFEPTLP